jgi:transcriptional regulator with XRE-family HTH domain
MEKLRSRLARRMREMMDADPNADTQMKVSARAGISQSSVQRILAQDQAATVDVLDQLAVAFHVSHPERLLLEADEQALLNEWSALTPTEKAAVLGYIRVAVQTRQAQLVIDTGRPVPAQLQAVQRASAGRPVSQQATLKNATTRSSKGKRRKS